MKNNGILSNALMLVNRRIRLCSKAPVCPKCSTNQVQLINILLLAKWRCRMCKFIWTHEPLTVDRKHDVNN